jgi:hypothetical protein
VASVVVTPSARETFTARELTDAYEQFIERGPQYVDAESGLRAAAYRFGERVLVVYEEPETGVVLLRACANRSWLSGGAAFPAVANPAFPDESTHYDDHIGERNPEADDSILPLGTPRQFLVGVMPGVRALDDPA